MAEPNRGQRLPHVVVRHAVGRDRIGHGLPQRAERGAAEGFKHSYDPDRGGAGERSRGKRDGEDEEAIKKLEKGKEIGEDDARRRLESLQKATDAKIAEIDRMAASKEREVLEG